MGLGYYTSAEKVKGGRGCLASSRGLTLGHALRDFLLLLGSIILILWQVRLLLASAKLAEASHRLLLLLLMLGQVRRLSHVLLLLLHHLHLHIILHL